MLFIAIVFLIIFQKQNSACKKSMSCQYHHARTLLDPFLYLFIPFHLIMPIQSTCKNTHNTQEAVRSLVKSTATRTPSPSGRRGRGLMSGGLTGPMARPLHGPIFSQNPKSSRRFIFLFKTF